MTFNALSITRGFKNTTKSIAEAARIIHENTLTRFIDNSKAKKAALKSSVIDLEYERQDVLTAVEADFDRKAAKAEADINSVDAQIIAAVIERNIRHANTFN